MLKRILPLLLFLLATVSHAQVKKAILINGATPIYTSAKPGDPLYKAVLALQRDMGKIFGQQPAIQPLNKIAVTGIVVVNSETDTVTAPIKGWERHQVFCKLLRNTPQIVVQGADTRGTIYAVYSFAEHILGVPPMWFFSSWKAPTRSSVEVKPDFAIRVKSPDVKYRAWFPNDTDLFTPWRRRSADNYELWLETALRLKLNTIEWFDAERDYAKLYSVSPTTRLINEYGLINTTHHHSPLNATFAGWADYWTKTRDTIVPELSLANTQQLEEFWRYNVESIVKNGINMLWVVGFRGMGDHPFWYTFKDAPESMKERGKIISEMLERQRRIVAEVTGNPTVQTRTIFYDELSDLLADGYIQPPNDPNFIWTYVAARRDHYPNLDMQQLDKSKNLLLGYYFNYQFTSTGSHLAAGEGPWKMEKNFRYVASKSSRPIAFSVVNAGNLREFMIELAANASMMWDFDSYSSDRFLLQFAKQYMGQEHATATSALIKNYYNAYWKPRQPELNGFDRQFIFQDLRYKRAMMELLRKMNEPFDANPLTDIPAEQLKGRTYRLVPEHNNATNQIDALINGSTISAQAFEKVATDADELYQKLSASNKIFFDDIVRQPAHFMHQLNNATQLVAKAYKTDDAVSKKELLKSSRTSLHAAHSALLSTEHDAFKNWYESDRVFGFASLFKLYDELQIRQERPNVLIILADDMGYADLGSYGSEISTPNIDALAKNGLRFANMYTNAWCSPSRASLMTGLYPHQAGVGVLAEPKPGPPGPYQGYLNTHCVTIAEVLKTAGYRTAISGKWHLGDSSAYWPARRGFDHAFGLISGAANYFNIKKTKALDVVRKMALDENPYTPPDSNFYMTDAITADAVQQLQSFASSEQPFFLYVAYTAPHWPLHALKHDIEKYNGKYNAGWDSLRTARLRKQEAIGLVPKGAWQSARDRGVSKWKDLTLSEQQEMASKMEVYAAQIDRMDQGVGDLINALEKSGKLNNTIVIFLSDNGASAEGGLTGFDRRNNAVPVGEEDSYMSYGRSWANLSNTPFPNYKKTLREGGVLTPMIVYWPKGMNPELRGSVTTQVAHLIDIMPTVCSVTGSRYPSVFQSNPIQPTEGVSFANLIYTGTTTERAPIYWGLQERRAMLMGHYKLTAADNNSPWQMFNLAKDRLEETDIYKKEPSIAGKMVQMWNAWAERVRAFDAQPKNTSEQ